MSGIDWNFYGALVQLVRIRACHARGHGFESRTHRKFFLIVSLKAGENPATLEEWQSWFIALDLKSSVGKTTVGSNPTSSAKFYGGVAQLVRAVLC